MFIYVRTDPHEHTTIKELLENSGLDVMLVSNSSVLIVTTTEANVDATMQLLDGTPGVTTAQRIDQHLNIREVELKEALRTNKCRLVFDVDRTLTQGGPGTIHPKIEEIFKKINDKGIRIYIATGRSMWDLNTILKSYPMVEKISIAENGGIILGFGQDNYLEFGHKTEPNKVLDYLQSKYLVREDMAQGERLTEVIFLKKDVGIVQIQEAVSKTKARVSIHESENSFHISERGVDKGTAVLELAKRMHWGNNMIITVGDTGLDAPMFRISGYSFAMGNCTNEAANAAHQVLNRDFEKGIEEIYEIIKKVS